MKMYSCHRFKLTQNLKFKIFNNKQLTFVFPSENMLNNAYVLILSVIKWFMIMVILCMLVRYHILDVEIYIFHY